MDDKTFTPLFPGLDKNELRLLCYLAFVGTEKHVPLVATGYRRRFRLTQQAYDSEIGNLRLAGYVKGDSYVVPDWHLSVLMYMQDNQQDWVKAFKELQGFTGNSVSRYLWDLSSLVHRGDFESAARLRRPYVGVSHDLVDLGRYVRRLAMSDSRYLKLLTSEECRNMTSELLYDLFSRYELDETVFEILQGILPQEILNDPGYRDEVEGYRFLMTGRHAASGGSTLWSLCISALRQAYAGNFLDSFMLFQKALDLQNPQMHLFPNPLLNYFYLAVMIILRRNGNRNRIEDAWQSLRLSRGISYSNENAFVCSLMMYHDQYGEMTHRYLMEKVHMRIKEDGTPLTYAFSYMIVSYFSIEREMWEEPGIDGQIPPYAILQHELSAWLPLGPEARSELTGKFGGGPLLGHARREETWERALRYVGAEIEGGMKDSGTGRKRLVWFVKGFHVTSVMEQNEAEDGRWINGRSFTVTRLRSSGLDFLDSLDQQVMRELLEKPNNITDTDLAIPLLADSGRLFYGDGSETPLLPVEVKEERPFLEARGQGKEIHISSNVAMDARGNIPRTVVSCTGTGTYSLIRVNALQRDILRHMLKQKSFPVSALIALRHSMDSMSGILDVKENLSTSVLNPIQSNGGILSVRIAPVRNEYEVSLLATGMPGGNFRDLPGDGEQRIYDDVDNLTHCVDRDLDKEEENYHLIHTFMEEEAKAEFHNYNEATLYTPEGLLALLSYIYDNRNRYFAEWPEGVRLKFKGDIKAEDVDVQVQTEEKWFKVEGVVRFGGKTMTLAELIEAYCSSDVEGFVRMEDDQYYRISETLRRHLAMLDAMPSATKKGKTVPLFEVGTLAKCLAGLRSHTDDSYEKLLASIKASFEMSPEVPDSITATLRDYQLEGYRWMRRLDSWGAGCCLADDMGLGKTLQALTFIMSKAEAGPALVVAPKSVIPNWVREAGRFAPLLNVSVLNSEPRRKERIHAAGAYDLILCTYGVLTTECTEISKRRWNIVCLDEAHQIKNRQSRASQAAMMIKADSRVILTGTPLQNHIGELWNLFQFINPGLLGPWQLFKDSYTLPTPDEEHMTMLKELTQPFILRRTKEEVLDELPDKYVTIQTVEMTEPEARMYEEMRRLIELKFKKGKSRAERDEASALNMSFFEELTKLRLVSCSMRLVYPEWKEQSSKVTALLELLESLMEDPENRCIIFSQFTSFLAMIKPELKKRNMEFLYMDGQTELEKRQEMVETFQRGDCPLFISSLKAGGLGINLTAANYVILLDPWWNPAIENQAMDRAHRLGQQRNVSVIRLVSGQTIEEKIMRLHEKKQSLSDEILADAGDSYKLTYEDILDMVAPF